MILMRATPLHGPLEGEGAPENRDFYGPWNGNERNESVWAQKAELSACAKNNIVTKIFCTVGAQSIARGISATISVKKWKFRKIILIKNIKGPFCVFCGPRYSCEKFTTFWHERAILYGVADPEPVPFWPLDPGSGMGKKSGSGSGMNNPDHISESLETIFWG